MATKITTGLIDSGAITSALIGDASITADDLHTTLDLTGKTVTVATATAGDNDTTVASTAFVSTAIANLADSAPSTLNTLNELAAALGDDANFSTTVTNSIATKLPLAGGTLEKALSSDTQSTPETILTLAAKYTSTGVDGAAGSGARLLFKIPDDSTNPQVGASIDGVKENSDDSISSTALVFSTSQNDATLDEAMRINSSGTVKMSVNGSVANLILDNDADTPYLRFDESSAAKFTIGESSIVGGGSGFYDLYAVSGLGQRFFTGAAERMRIDTSGDVRLAANATGAALVKGVSGDQVDRNTGGYPQYTFVGNEGTGMRRPITNILAFDTSGSERMRIDSSGNVGIGTASYNVHSGTGLILHATTGGTGNTGSPRIRLTNTTTGQGATNGAELSLDGNTSDFYIENREGEDIILYSGSERMRITNTGDITMSGTGSLKVPSGTTAQRPSASNGMIRYNTSESKFEVYNGMWLPMKTEAPLEFQQASTYHRTWTIAADGQSAQAGSGYSAISVNLNFEGNFTIITKWSHDYMGIGIGYKNGITNGNFTGESADGNGPYGGASNVDGFDSTVSYMGQYHWPVSNGGIDDHQTTWYIKHQRVGNVISTHYSTNAASATNPSHSSWSQVQSATISSTDHCKPLWGEASGNESVALTLLYNDITGGFNST